MHLTANLNEAIEILKRGGVIVYPTDTVYGLGARFSNKYAERRIYKIKGRSGGKPLPVIVASLAMAREFFRFSARELVLAKKYWPGPLSLLLCEKKSKRFVVARVPDSKIARKLSAAIGEPIFSTSANLSGKGEYYSPMEVTKQFTNRLPLSKRGHGGFLPDLIFDGGRLKKKKPSTIIKVVDDRIEVLRQGPIRIKN